MVDKIKRDTRARMAATGETYTEARRAVAADAPTAGPPSPAELRAAVGVLLRAWTPGAAPGSDDDVVDPEECGCGGEDDDGRPICVCAGNCWCSGCRHQEHRETRLCRAQPPNPGPYHWCAQPTTLVITPYCVNPGSVTRVASDGDPEANQRGQVRLGDTIQRHNPTYACNTQHARELIDRDQQQRAGVDPASPLSAANTFYEVEQFNYNPDPVDVPGPLHQLHANLTSAAWWTQQTIAATFTRPRADADALAAALLRYVAWSVEGAVDYVEHRARTAADG